MKAIIMTALFLSLNVQAELTEPISTDRPDATESVDSVEAGHYQFELNLTNFERERNKNSYGLLGVNAKFGIGYNSDLQLVFNAWNKDESESSVEFTDWGLRLKHELLSGKRFSISALPYYIFAGSSDNGFAGIALPWETPLRRGFELKGMSQFGEAIPDENRVFQFLQTLEITKDFDGKISGFTELIYILPDTDDAEEFYINYGLAYLLDDHTQLDFALAHGLTSCSDDLRFITGLSFKR